MLFVPSTLVRCGRRAACGVVRAQRQRGHEYLMPAASPEKASCRGRQDDQWSRLRPPFEPSLSAGQMASCSAVPEESFELELFETAQDPLQAPVTAETQPHPGPLPVPEWRSLTCTEATPPAAWQFSLFPPSSRRAAKPSLCPSSPSTSKHDSSGRSDEARGATARTTQRLCWCCRPIPSCQSWNTRTRDRADRWLAYRQGQALQAAD